jgi:AcrR family transcriptional regulator
MTSKPAPVRNPPAAKASASATGATAKATGEDTRARIIEATIQTLRTEGIVGTSARTIARHGGFNQALVFYHFGSVEGLLVATSAEESSRRAARYAGALEGVATLPDLVAVARRIHDEEVDEGAVTVLTQLLAGASGNPVLKGGLAAGFAPWMDLVDQAVTRVLDSTPLAGLLPTADLTFAISSLFLGIELLTAIDPDDQRGPALFRTFDTVATMLDLLLKTPAVEAVVPSARSARPAASEGQD